jgi:hypothetical protein
MEPVLFSAEDQLKKPGQQNNQQLGGCRTLEESTAKPANRTIFPQIFDK